MSNPGVSLRPSDAVESSKFDDVDVVLKSVRTCFFDYNGKIAAPGAPAIEVEFENVSDQSTFKEHYTAGDAAKLVPSSDGRRFEPVITDGGSSPAGLGKNSNAMQLITSILNAGFPEDRLTDEVTPFTGLKAHMNRVTQNSAKNSKDKGAQDRTVLVVTKIHALPGEKGASAGAKKGPAKVLQGPTPAPAAAQGGDDADDINALAVATVMEVLGEAGTPLSVKDVNTKVFGKLGTNPLRNRVVQRMYQKDFFPSGPWTFENQTLSLG